jgi:hypothetical protein
MVELTFRTIGGKTFKVEAEPATSVADLKAKVEAAQGADFPAAQLKLVYKVGGLTGRRARTQPHRRCRSVPDPAVEQPYPGHAHNH